MRLRYFVENLAESLSVLTFGQFILAADDVQTPFQCRLDSTRIDGFLPRGALNGFRRR